MSAKALLSASVSAGPAAYVEDVFSTYLYTGNGSTQTITNGIDLAGEGGLVWFKRRDATGNNTLTDTANNGRLFTDLTNALNTNALVSSFNADGFSLNTASAPNQSASNYASWTFRKAEKFFDVVTWTGNDTNRTIAHNLGSVPGCIIVKKTSGSASWNVYHRSTGNTNVLFLNLTDASTADSTRWNNTTPTATEFSLGTSDQVNQSGATYVAYLFAHDAGGFGDAGTDSVISCGSYTGNGSTSGPTVTLGWEPQWLLIKRTDSAGYSWFLHDTMRQMSLTNTAYLAPDSSSAEGLLGSALVDLSATGFQLKTNIPSFNSSGATYIYIAIRRGPMKTPTDATKVFDVETFSSDPATVTTGFPVDMIMNTRRDGTAGNAAVVDRLRGSTTSASRWVKTSNTDSESIGSGFGWGLDSNTGWEVAGAWGATPQVGWSFRRAPGFFDVVAYTGTNGLTRTINHNLGISPELVIIKSRSGSGAWFVSAPAILGTTHPSPTLLLDSNQAAAGFDAIDAVTSTTFTTAQQNDAAVTYITYLFATCPGVSKVGSYTGTGTTLNVDCGFTAGARFVLIKRTDSTGDWYVWDTARGIISGDDPYLLLNTTAAEVTNTDYIDPLSSGFQITSTAPAAINASGGSFIFLAIA